MCLVACRRHIQPKVRGEIKLINELIRRKMNCTSGSLFSCLLWIQVNYDGTFFIIQQHNCLKLTEARQLIDVPETADFICFGAGFPNGTNMESLMLGLTISACRNGKQPRCTFYSAIVGLDFVLFEISYETTNASVFCWNIIPTSNRESPRCPNHCNYSFVRYEARHSLVNCLLTCIQHLCAATICHVFYFFETFF